MNANLPTRVQRQLEAADALLAASAAPRVEGVVDDAASLMARLEPPPAPAAPPAPTAPPAASAPVAAPTPPAPAATAEDARELQRQKTLQGRLIADNADLRATNAAMLSRLNALEQRTAAAPAAPAAPAQPQPDAADLNRFGEEMMEMVQRMARQTLASMRTEVGQLVTPLVGRVDALEKAVTGVTKVTAASTEDAFFAMLDDQVPGWEATNASQPWLDWLASKDPVYGLPRQAALDAAFERKDGRHAVAIFKQFLSEQATPATPEPRPSLESLVAPSAGGGAAVTPSAPEAKPILSQKFIRDFYSHVSRGRYANDPEGQKRISQEIDLAVAEGRVSST